MVFSRTVLNSCSLQGKWHFQAKGGNLSGAVGVKGPKLLSSQPGLQPPPTGKQGYFYSRDSASSSFLMFKASLYNLMLSNEATEYLYIQ